MSPVTELEMAVEYWSSVARGWHPRYVPAVVKLFQRVRSESLLGECRCAPPGAYAAEVNPQGAVSIVTPGGQRLALGLGQFEVLAWRMAV